MAAMATVAASPVTPRLPMEVTDVETLSESPEQPLDVPTQTKVTGWLSKRKGDATRSRLFGGSNRRFFTLDFEAKLFYYSHTESNKTASVPVAFRNVTRVEPLSGALECAQSEDMLDGPAAADGPSSGNKGSLGAHVRGPKRSFGAPRRPQEQHGLLVTVAGRDMELTCATKAESDEWVAAFRRAIASGVDCQGKGTIAPGLAGLEATEPSTSTGSASGDSRAGTPQSLHSCSDNGLLESVAEIVPTAAPPPSIEEPQQRPATSGWGSRASGAAAGGRRAIGMLLRRPLQQGDACPKKQAHGGLTNVENMEPNSAWAEDRNCFVTKESAAVEGSMAGRYGDKGAGLSLQERLAQMEFSDSEDEDPVA